MLTVGRCSVCLSPAKTSPPREQGASDGDGDEDEDEDGDGDGDGETAGRSTFQGGRPQV